MKTKSKLSTYILRGGAIMIFSVSAVLLRADASTEGSWTTRAPLPSPRWIAASAALDGKFYVVGGSATNTVFVYDPQNDSWSTKTSLPQVRDFATPGVINGQLYVAGGFETPLPGYRNSLYFYNPLTDTWSAKASMPGANARMS